MAGNPLKKGRYTEYSNKIGLFDNSSKQFIGNSPEVVLSFPFKDAVLEAGIPCSVSSYLSRLPMNWRIVTASATVVLPTYR